MKSLSSKPQMLIVDHEFHIKTRSFDFLFKLLQERFETRIVYVDPAAPVDRDALLADCEYVFICQLDFLTPLFIAAGKRVVVVQMYDGSSGLPSDHWELNRQARYLNFSVALHARALEHGAESKLVRFFPNPAEFPQVESFETQNVFFWQRLPRSSVNICAVRRLMGSQIDSLHVHTPADDGTPFDLSTLAAIEAKTTTSTWFPTRDEFLKTLARSNVYFAPRLAEGIGHGFLEALARGMVVLAHDAPTHNEYIANGVTGILFNDSSGSVVTTEEQRRAMGNAARLSIENGFLQWSQDKLTIADWVLETPAAKVPPGVLLTGEVDAVLAAYQRGLGDYIAKLKESRALVAVLAHWHELISDPIDSSDSNSPENVGTMRSPSGETERAIEIFAGSTYGNDVVFEGWSDPEWSHRWAVQREASISIKCERAESIVALECDMRALSSLPLTLSLGSSKIGQIELSRDFTLERLELARPIQVEAGDRVRINFRSERPFYRRMQRVEARRLTFCLKMVRLLSG